MVNYVVLLIISLIIISIVSGISSPLMTISKIIMLGLAFLHAVFAGALIGILLKYSINLGIPTPIASITFTIILSLVAAELVERGFPTDSAVATIAAISTSLIATLGFIVSRISPIALSEAWSYVVGVSSLISLRDLFIIVSASIIILPLFLMFNKEFMFIAFDEDSARAYGLRVRLYRYLLYSLCGLTSAILAMVLGIFVAHIILVVPGVFALKAGKGKLFRVSLAVCLTSTLLGYFLAYLLNIPASGGIGIVSTFMLIAIYVLKRG